jgi:hypothetical protein
VFLFVASFGWGAPDLARVVRSWDVTVVVVVRRGTVHCAALRLHGQFSDSVLHTVSVYGMHLSVFGCAPPRLRPPTGPSP